MIKNTDNTENTQNTTLFSLDLEIFENQVPELYER